MLFLNFCGFHMVLTANTPHEIRKNGIITDRLSNIFSTAVLLFKNYTILCHDDFFDSGFLTDLKNIS